MAGCYFVLCLSDSAFCTGFSRLEVPEQALDGIPLALLYNTIEFTTTLFFLQYTSRQQMLLWALSLLDCVEVAVETVSQMAFREAGKWGRGLAAPDDQVNWLT